MARKKAMTFNCPEMVLMRFRNICLQTGASINYCMERVLMRVIKEGSIEGIDPMDDHEQREREKFGVSAVPVIDLEQPTAGAKVSRRQQPVK